MSAWPTVHPALVALGAFASSFLVLEGRTGSGGGTSGPYLVCARKLPVFLPLSSSTSLNCATLSVRLRGVGEGRDLATQPHTTIVELRLVLRPLCAKGQLTPTTPSATSLLSGLQGGWRVAHTWRENGGGGVSSKEPKGDTSLQGLLRTPSLSPTSSLRGLLPGLLLLVFQPPGASSARVPWPLSAGPAGLEAVSVRPCPFS